jgi:hypothetical protein
MKVEIEIPDPPEGWVFDGFRQAHVHERVLSGCCWVTCHINTLAKHFACIKEKPLWEPSPELVAVLNPGWIARDHDGKWHWYGDRPTRVNIDWQGDSMHAMPTVRRSVLPPVSIPWHKSCFKIGEPQE